MPKRSRAAKRTPMTVDEVRGLRELVFRFGDHEQTAEHDTVPLKLALQQLTHFEQAVRSLAAYHRAHHDAPEGRTSPLPASDFELELGAIRPRCTEVVIGVGRPAEDLQSPDRVAQMGTFCDLLHRATACAHDGGIDQLRKLVKDGDCVRSVAASFEKIGHLQPKLRVRISNARNEVLYGEGRSRPLHLTAGPVTAEVAALPLDRTTFIGHLRTIGVKHKRLTLDLCGGGALNVPYQEFSNLGIEVDREAIVEVHGVGETRSPRATPWLTSLEQICPIDESEVVVDRLELDQQPFVADPPLRFTVKFNAKEGRYEVDGDFEIHFAECSRAEVESRVLDEIAFS